MIKVFIDYNKGNPKIGLRALRNDTNSSNTLRLLAKAIEKGEPISEGIRFTPSEVRLQITTNLKKEPYEET